jgi:hypothetical protein
MGVFFCHQQASRHLTERLKTPPFSGIISNGGLGSWHKFTKSGKCIDTRDRLKKPMSILLPEERGCLIRFSFSKGSLSTGGFGLVGSDCEKSFSTAWRLRSGNVLIRPRRCKVSRFWGLSASHWLYRNPNFSFAVVSHFGFPQVSGRSFKSLIVRWAFYALCCDLSPLSFCCSSNKAEFAVTMVLFCSVSRSISPCCDSVASRSFCRSSLTEFAVQWSLCAHWVAQSHMLYSVASCSFVALPTDGICSLNGPYVSLSRIILTLLYSVATWSFCRSYNKTEFAVSMVLCAHWVANITMLWLCRSWSFFVVSQSDPRSFNLFHFANLLHYMLTQVRHFLYLGPEFILYS